MKYLYGVCYSFFLLCGCSASPEIQDEPEIICVTDEFENRRALVDIKCVSTSIEFERVLNSREDVLNGDGGWFDVVEGTIPVVISAPHATRPFRNGERRFSDGGGTAALAIAVGQLTGATVIYTTFEGPSDPNYYDDNDYKKELSKIINDNKPYLLLDIHGSHPYRSYDVDLGTMRGKSLLGRDEILSALIASLEIEGVDSISINRFGASKNETVTKFASSKGVPAVQMEINANWVSPSVGDINAHRYSIMVQALTRFILSMEENVSKSGTKGVGDK